MGKRVFVTALVAVGLVLVVAIWGDQLLAHLHVVFWGLVLAALVTGVVALTGRRRQ